MSSYKIEKKKNIITLCKCLVCSFWLLYMLVWCEKEPSRCKSKSLVIIVSWINEIIVINTTRFKNVLQDLNKVLGKKATR